MTDPDQPVGDADLFRSAWAVLAFGLFVAACFGAVGLYRWYHAAQLRPLD